MLGLALRTRDGREVGGQIVRLFMAAIGSATGRFPAGNTGRARVPIAQPMDLPEDLARTLAAAGADVRDVTVRGRRQRPSAPPTAGG
jgi:hypothetical protein